MSDLVVAEGGTDTEHKPRQPLRTHGTHHNEKVQARGNTARAVEATRPGCAVGQHAVDGVGHGITRRRRTSLALRVPPRVYWLFTPGLQGQARGQPPTSAGAAPTCAMSATITKCAAISAHARTPAAVREIRWRRPFIRTRICRQPPRHLLHVPRLAPNSWGGWREVMQTEE